MEPITPAALPDRIDALRRTLALARGLAGAGRRIDLSGLEVEVAAICRTLEGLPRPQAAGYATALTTLLREVEALAATLATP
ncbi:MAG: hypothetical protein RMK64_04585 [Rhodovarius sp.]|nr:hypothetical protein [Rhodovarius sp.]MCX7933057.1 hypothetical protein [Rhodovarius sp.]MDW8314227.1 hypothetical protein [Rhodovarius sp.]